MDPFRGELLSGDGLAAATDSGGRHSGQLQQGEEACAAYGVFRRLA